MENETKNEDSKKKPKEPEFDTIPITDQMKTTIELIEEELKEAMIKQRSLQEHAQNFITMCAEQELKLQPGTWRFDPKEYVFKVLKPNKGK